MMGSNRIGLVMGFALALLGCQRLPEASFDVGAGQGQSLGTGPSNCVGMCARAFILCRRAGGDPAGCAAEREACKDECDRRTCEPGEPGCCQGQPTCW